jgi:imidazolonepropionase-like amidohydrolase
VTTLIRNGIVLPMIPGRRIVLDPGSVLVDADRRATGAEIIDATGHAVIPGLTNCQ